MPWGPLKNSEICAIHAAVVPTANGDGEVIYFGGDEHSPPALLAGEIDKSRRMNCRTEAVSYVASPPADLFCCGHAFLSDGRLVVGGGTKTFAPESPGDHGEMGHFTGERRCWVYNSALPGFVEIASFGPEPGQELTGRGGGRWYPGIVTLRSGQVLAVTGHPAGDDKRHVNDTPERYDPVTNAWTRLLPLPHVFGDAYPRMHTLPDGSVLVTGSVEGTIRYDAEAGKFAKVADGPGGMYDLDIGASSVLLPLLPEEDYRVRVLVTGDVKPRLLDLGATQLAWTDTESRTGSAAGKVRRNAGAVLLPTGKVLVVGGAEDGTKDSTCVNQPEIYDPAANSWKTLEEPAAQPRNYHSTALLLPDGRVWTAGSNVNSGITGDGVDRRVLNFEIFTPPYPAGARPTIQAAPGLAVYGQRFRVDTPSAARIQRVVLMRCGSMTHAFDSDQRCVGLKILSRNATAVVVAAPPNGGVAPPGYYMLFLIDDRGRPSPYAHFIRVCEEPRFGPWASVSEGRTMPGAPVTAVPWGQRFAVFLSDPAGGIYTTGGDPQGGFGPWASVSEGRSMPGAPVTAVPWGARFALFLADPNGGIYTAGGDPQAGFGPWASVSEGRSMPGARVTAVPWGQRFAVFLSDPNGGIYTTGGDPQAGFGPWASVSEGRSTPGAPVTAVPWGQRFALFLSDPHGGIYTAAGDPQAGFGPWARVSEGTSTPGASVTAVPWGQRVALFVSDPDGGIYATVGDPQTGFGPWVSVSDGRSMPGAQVTAVPRGNGFALFLSDPNGGIYATAGDPRTGFAPWVSVSDGRSTPGAPVTAVPWGPRFALFLADPNGGFTPQPAIRFEAEMLGTAVLLFGVFERAVTVAVARC